MKCTLFLPYTQYRDSSFTCDDNYYSDESYADALNKGLEESKNAVDNTSTKDSIILDGKLQLFSGYISLRVLNKKVQSCRIL